MAAARCYFRRGNVIFVADGQRTRAQPPRTADHGHPVSAGARARRRRHAGALRRSARLDRAHAAARPRAERARPPRRRRPPLRLSARGAAARGAPVRPAPSDRHLLRRIHGKNSYRAPGPRQHAALERRAGSNRRIDREGAQGGPTMMTTLVMTTAKMSVVLTVGLLSAALGRQSAALRHWVI